MLAIVGRWFGYATLQSRVILSDQAPMTKDFLKRSLDAACWKTTSGNYLVALITWLALVALS